jgi:hypothetical protein
MGSLMLIQSQLLATKFSVPTFPGTLIRRPRLSALLDESLKSSLCSRYQREQTAKRLSKQSRSRRFL